MAVNLLISVDMFVMSVRRVCMDCETASNSAVSFLSRASNDSTHYGFKVHWFWVVGSGFGFWVVIEITLNSMASSLQPDGDGDTPVYRK